MRSVDYLPSKPIQINTHLHPGDWNCGVHSVLTVLCEDGSIWNKYESTGKSNVPTDGKWYEVRTMKGGEE